MTGHAPSGSSRARTLGVVGTLVWDTIHHPGGSPDPTEDWGGIGYALEALTASLPDDWKIMPILKVGRDLSDEALRFLGELPSVRREPGIVIVPEDNNRVELRYREGHERDERLRGGVPPWHWPELRPLTDLCDALYLNFISGFEMGLPAVQSLRAGFAGPMYADLHSLFLGVGRQGDRIPRPLPHWSEWIRSFDAVQMNEDEFDLLGRAHGDPWRLAADRVGAEVRLVTVTLGSRGAAYVAGAGFRPEPFTWIADRGRMAAPGPARSARVEPDSEPVESGDPTGCGDVWGATCFARLLAGDELEEAMRTANRMAGRNVEHAGARGLGRHLSESSGGPEGGG